MIGLLETHNLFGQDEGMSLMYFVLISVAFFVALAVVTLRNKIYKLPSYHVLNIFILSPIVGLICARLFHVVYEQWDQYANDPSLFFYYWIGGYVYYAGAIGGFLAAWIYLRKNKQALRPYLDLYVIPISIGSGIGRWACFAAGCCFGKYCELPWAIEGRHPTAIYSFLWEMGLVAIMLGLEKRGRRNLIVPLWLVGHGMGRLIIEQLRGDDRGPIHLLSISSWISIAFILIGILVIYLQRAKRVSK